MINLERLKKLHAGSTQGEWRVNEGHGGYEFLMFLVRPDCDGISFGSSYIKERQAQHDADAIFAAEAHQAVPELIAEIEHMREIVGNAVREAEDGVDNCMTNKYSADVMLFALAQRHALKLLAERLSVAEAR